MDNKLEINEKSMLKGLGAASISTTAAFLMSILLKTTGGESIADVLNYIIAPLCAAMILIMLLTDEARDFFVRLLTFIATGAALLMIYVRIGYKSALKSDIEKGLLDSERLEFFAVYLIIFAALAVISAGIASIVISRRFTGFIEKTEPLHNRMSVFSIAAAFICIAAASMIYG